MRGYRRSEGESIADGCGCMVLLGALLGLCVGVSVVHLVNLGGSW